MTGLAKLKVTWISRWLIGVHLPMQETQEIQVQTLSQEDPLEEEVKTHSSVLAWRIPWTEEHAGQSP